MGSFIYRSGITLATVGRPDCDSAMVKVTTKAIRQLKGKRPVVCLTAYDAITAGLLSAAGVDLILVGDSYGMTHLGYETTIPVTVEMMLHATASVTRAKPNSLVITDVPFGIVRRHPDTVLEICTRFLQEGGADGVKLEGGADIAPTVELLTQAGIPVFGHVGLLPQQVLQLGGYRKFGKAQAEQDKIVRDARAVQDAGAFAVLGEMITDDAARAVRDSLEVPLIGIGCGPHCDGQILVSTDVLGLTPYKVPAFVKTYANLKETMHKAFSTYASEVREGKFPA